MFAPTSIEEAKVINEIFMVLLDLVATCGRQSPPGSVAIARFGQHPLEARFGVFVRTPPFTKIVHQAPWSSRLSLHI